MLLPDKLTLMQRIQDGAVYDFAFYLVGECPAEKWGRLQQKMVRTYEANLTPSTRARRRRSGEAVTMVYGASPPPFRPDGPIQWVLMASQGAGLVHRLESLKELSKDRIELDGYELVHDGVGWSWRMTRARQKYWANRIHEICAYPPAKRREKMRDGVLVDPDIEEVMDVLFNTPGFRLVRRQVGQLVTLAKREWQRHRPSNGPKLLPRTFLPYVRRLPNKKRVVEEVVSIADVFLDS